MTSSELKKTLSFTVRHKEFISDLLFNQKEDDILNGQIRIQKNDLIKHLINFLKQKNLIPSQVMNYNIEFSGNILIIKLRVMPSKIIGLINITYFMQLSSLKISNGKLKAIISLREELDKYNGSIKKFALSSLTTNQMLLEYAIKKKTLPEKFKAEISGNFLNLTIISQTLAAISFVDLYFKEFKNDFAYFKFASAPKHQNTGAVPANVQLESDYGNLSKNTSSTLRDMLNYSDRF